jgi:hypothetical protein
VKDKDAVALLVEAMKTSGKVYKNCKIYGGKDEQTDRMVQTAINYSLKPLDKGHVIWKGLYGEKGKIVEYWFFMVGILVIRGVDGYWCLVGPHISKKQWQTWAKEMEA